MSERLWIGNDGKYQVQATYICLFKDKKVKLRKPNGVVIAIPLNLLSLQDIAFINSQSHTSKIELTSSTSSSLVSLDTKTSVEELTPSTQQDESTIPSCTKHVSIPNTALTSLPSKPFSLICSYLDVQSKLRLSNLCHKLHHMIFKPSIWTTLSFDPSYTHTITDTFYYHLIIYLQQRGQLQKCVQKVYLDHTKITSKSFLLSIKYLLNLDFISIASCWQVYSYQLASDLTFLVKKNQYPSKISRVMLGKVLHRGLITLEDQSKLDSKSFGQDAWFINAALNKLSNKNVLFDVVTCGQCHLGAAAQDFFCGACGILPLKKCVGCSPRCDRCGTRTCGLDTCIDPKIKVQLARCGRCESTLSLCNMETSTVCQEARKPCGSCHRLYHVQCRALDGTYLSNQCTSCGIVACPHCELSACSSGCLGQWCKKCVVKAHLGHCKCIVIQGNTSSKSMMKRNVCGQCQKSCTKCKTDHFCDRCLHLHGLKCT